MSAQPRTIFIYSMEPWGDMWYSKHHYAAYLAKTHTVYFVALPDRWRWTDLFSLGVTLRTTPERVNVVQYRNNLPLRYLPRWLSALVGRMNASKLRKLVPSGEVIHWCFHPINVAQGRALHRAGSRLIYHVVDPYQSFDSDRPLAKEADLVVAINPWYLEYYGRINPHCILVPHGVRHEDRTFRPEAVAQARKEYGRYAVLATGLSYSVNYRLLLRVAERFRDLHLVIVGQLFALEPADEELRQRLFNLPHVTYAGVKHPDELKQLVRGAAVGLLTYDFEVRRSVPAGAGRTPLKVLTYLSQLCPVVSTNNSYVPALDDKGYFKADDEAQFLDIMAEVLDGRRTVDVPTVEGYLDSVEYGLLIDRVFKASDGAAATAIMERPPERIVDAADDRLRVPKESPILIVSNEEWDGPRYSKHRFALALNHRRDVYFVDPAAQWRPSHLFRMRVRSRATPEGITVLSYFNAIPLFGGALRGINDTVVATRLRRHLNRMGRFKPVFWTFDPSRLAAPALLDPCVAVYHCADDHALRWRGERALAKRCDHVFCIARDLMPRFRPLNKSVLHVPHGISEEDLDPTPLSPAELPAPPGYGLYIGNINDRHDFALWEALFKRHPDITWLVVGPVQVTDPIGRRLFNEQPYPNVHFLGLRPYTELRGLIAGAGFGFLYMHRDHPANRISSQKVIQFLAQGKPFFCSWFSEYADRQDLVHMSDDHASALKTFERWRATGEPSTAAAARTAFTAQQRFGNLIDQLPFIL